MKHSIANASDEKVFEACRLFLEDEPEAKPETEKPMRGRPKRSDSKKESSSAAVRLGRVALIAERLEVSREDVYTLLRVGLKRNFIRLVPPWDDQLCRAIERAFQLGDPQHVRVVASDAAAANAQAAADLVLKHLSSVATTKQGTVHLGFASGLTMHAVATHLARILPAELLPRLVIHTVTAALSYTEPRAHPAGVIAPFTHLPGINYRHFLVAPGGYKELAGGKEATKEHDDAKKAREDIDVLVSSLANRKDKHSQLAKALPETNKAKWVGDLLYCPFSETEPVEAQGMAPISLFDFDSLLSMAAKPGKHIVLVAGKCTKCDEDKVPAIVPLLESPALRAWTDLVLPENYATDVLDEARKRARARG